MQFRFIQLLDQVLGKFLLLFLNPLCGFIARWLPAHPPRDTPKTITIMKLHGGGSLLIAMPALLGLRQKFPQATFTLIGTPDTQKYASVTGLFDNYVTINPASLFTLIVSGIKAAVASHRQDLFIDLEPHSMLASVFTPLTFAARRIGFVKPNEAYRAPSYTDAIYFNLYSPIYRFYEQVAVLLNAGIASMKACQTTMKAQRDDNDPVLQTSHPRPVIYVSAFTSSLSPERMMSNHLWTERLQKKFGGAPFTVIIGGGPAEMPMADAMAKHLVLNLPAARIINACGKRSLQQSMADIDSSDEFWGIDSGPMHIARLLGKRCTTFWGPTNPAYRLKTFSELDETVHYAAFPCSPCVHLAAEPPCKGDNQCMKQLFLAEPSPPVWLL